MVISNKISNSLKRGSWIRKMFEEGIALKNQYGIENVFDLSLGNPILEPPQEFFTELKNIADNPVPGMHRYMPNGGYLETRSAVARQMSIETGFDFTSDEILMTCGAGGALNVVMRTLLDPGDEVIVFSPYFVEYLFYADNYGANCSIVPPDQSYLPDLDTLSDSINHKTRIVLYNSPNNPTGVVYPSDVLTQIATIIQHKEKEFGTKIHMVSDEPYRKIIFDEISYDHVFKYHPRSIVVTSHSKDLGLAGERIGFIGIHPEYQERTTLMDGLTFCNRTLGFVNAPALMQHIVSKLQSVTVNISTYQETRDFLYDKLSDIGYSIVRPGGGFYMFPKAPIPDDITFVDELRKHRVLVVPGVGFGMEGHFRISYAVPEQEITGSLAGFQAAFDRYSS